MSEAVAEVLMWIGAVGVPLLLLFMLFAIVGQLTRIANALEKMQPSTPTTHRDRQEQPHGTE